MATATRTIIQTDTPGWFLDPATDKKTRKQDGDTVMTRAEYDQMLLDNEDKPAADVTDTPAEAPVEAPTTEATKPASRKPTAKADAEVTALTSGKVAVGKTLKIRCAWVDPEKRTPEQAVLFNTGFAGVEKGKTYEAVKAAAGNKRSAFPDGSDRVIKVQDAFQVRFSPDNQKLWRNELRRRNNAAKREAVKAAKGA